MVAIVSGTGIGLERSSANQLGSRGTLGSAFLGRANDGVTVNAATGNLLIQNSDEILIGRGPDAIVSRTYNSQGTYSNLDGVADIDNWWVNSQRKVVLTGTANDTGSSVALTDWDGSIVTFNFVSVTVGYKSSEFPYQDDVIRYTASPSSWTWTEGKSRRVEAFESTQTNGSATVDTNTWRLSTSSDADGNTVTYSYEVTTSGKRVVSDRLTQIVTANATTGQNNSLLYIYDTTAGKTSNLLSVQTNYYDLATSTNKTLTRVRYTYDSLNRLQTVRVDKSPGDGIDNDAYVTSYSYAGTSGAAAKQVASISQSDGTSLAISYDGAGRVQLLEQIPAAGVRRRTAFAYDTINGIVTITQNVSNGGVVNPDAAMTFESKMYYDTANRLVRLDEPPHIAGANPQVTIYEYTSGQVTKILKFDSPANIGNASLAIDTLAMSYDANGNLLQTVDGTGRTTSYAYGLQNELLSSTVYTGLDPDGILGALPSGGQVTNYAYDIENHLRFVVSPEGRVTEYRYDLYGNQTAQITYTNNSYSGTYSENTLVSWVSTIADKTAVQRVDTAYDFRLNVTSVTSYSKTDINGNGPALEDWTCVDYTYDQYGKLLSRRTSGANALTGYAEPLLTTETFVYDGMGRVISSTDIYGVASSITYTETAASRTITITTPNDTTRTSTYNIAGELTSFAESGPGIGIQTTLYEYDALGRLRIRTDPVGVKTYFLYDREGRLVGEVDGDGSLTEFKYDANDRVIATAKYATAVSIAALGTTTTNVEILTIRPASNASDRWSWSIFDKAGRLTQTIDATGATQQFTYDGAGRLLVSARFATVFSSSMVDGFKTTFPQAAILPPAYDDTNDRRVFNFYDNDGLQIGVLDEDGFLTEFIYDKAGRKIETIRYSMQAGYYLADVSRPSHWRNSSFAALKATADDGPANDIHNYWLYEGRGRIGATIDGEGNVTRYHYNVRGQVDQEVRGQQVAANTFYSLASLPAASGVLETTSFTFNAAGQMLTQVKLLSAGQTETTTYTYDTRGRLLMQTVTETVSTETRTQRFRYDEKGRLIGSLGGVGAATLAANATDAQIAAAINVYGTRFVYDVADRLIAKFAPDSSGQSVSVKTVYYYDTDGQLRYEIKQNFFKPNPVLQPTVWAQGGEVTEYRYNVLEDRSEAVVYGSRIDATTLSSLNGGLVSTSVTAAVTAIASSALDSRTQMLYSMMGQLNYVYNPLYPAQPTTSNYQSQHYNAFGEMSAAYNPTDTAAYNWDYQIFGYNRRGLHQQKVQYLNGSALGSIDGRFNYDAFGRLSNAYENNIDSRGASYSYDRANRLSKEWEEPGAAGGYRQTWYNSLNNKTSFRDRTGNITSFGYDVMDKNGTAIAAGNRTGHYRTVTTTTAEGVVSRQTANAYGQTISVTDGAGRTTSYTYDKNGNLKTTTDAAGTTVNSYDNADRLFEVMDARGVKTRYTYDAVGRVLTEVRDHGGIGATTTYQYDAKGQQTRVTDARGVVTDLAYDLKGQKLTVTQDVGGFAITTKYDYRADGKVSRLIEALGKPEQRITDYKYDTMGRLLEEIVDPSGLNLSTKYSYDVNNNVVSITDARNNVSRLIYDKENRQILSVSPHGEVVETGYDSEGRAIWSRSYVNRIAQTTVDGFATQVAESTVRAGFVADASKDRITRTIYDGDGRRTYAIDGEGYVTRFKYDGANNILKTVVYATAFGSATNATSKADLDIAFGAVDIPPTTASVTTFTYDNANRLTSTIDAEGFAESYEYDAVGNRTKLTNRLNGVTNFTFDNLNRVRTEYVHGLIYNDIGTQTALGYYKNQFEYDALGNVTRQVEGNIALLASYGAVHSSTARETKFEYDKLGRLSKKTQDTFQANLTPVETFAYDARGNLVLYTDPSLSKTFTYYDADNRKIASVSQVNTVGGGQATYQSWSYDGSGNLVLEKTWGTLVPLPSAVTLAPPLVPGGEYRETTFEYDRNGRLKKRIISNIRTGIWINSAYNSNTAQTLTVESVYDAFGSLIREIDANNHVSHHWYDRSGREYAKIDNENYLTVWYRDEDGNVTEERRLANKVTGAFNEQSTRDQLITATAFNANDRITTFTYDKNGRRTALVRYNLTDTISGAGAAINTALQSSAIYYGYNGLGEVTARAEANGDVTTYNYDNQGRLSWQRDAAITDYNGNSAYRRTLLFYDALGNLVRSNEQAVDASGNYAIGYSNADDRITRYGYDKGRLIWTTDATNFTRNSSYDVNSRVVEESYIRYKADGLTALQEGTLTSYDLGGRVTQTRTAQWIAGSWVDQAPIATFSYNAYNEVASKLLGGVVQEQFVYDLAGRVTKSTVGDGIWKFFGYDANGNVTITLTSAGDNLTGFPDLASALPFINSEGQNATYVVYDKRNMAVQTIEEGRRLTATGALVNLTSSRAYNAFGEVTSETDALNNTTNYSYNTMGRVTKVEAPTVSVTSESGVVSNIRPTQLFYFDIAGRQTGTRDANLYLTTRTLLAGTGHEGSEALVISEYRPDSSVWGNGYDVFRDQRKLTDGLNRITTQAFDKAGRVTQITRPATTAGTLIDSYVYDGLGRKVMAWNNLYGSADAATTDYDALGRVTSQRAQGGDVTTISYVWNAGLSTTGVGTFGGWEETTTYANAKTIISKTDTFGRELFKQDMGLHQFTITYDVAGRMISRTGSGGTVGSIASGNQTYTYFNTGQLSGISGSYGTAAYGYDASGNRISETATSAGGTQITNATASYDAMGRMTNWAEAGSATTPAASSSTQYDANGNIRRTQASHAILNGYGNVTWTVSDDYWYRFDALNRVVLDKGSFDTASSSIVRGSGTSYEFDAAGQRVASIETAQFQAHIDNPDYDGSDYIPQYLDISYSGDRRTNYGFDNAGRLAEVRAAVAGYADNGNGTVSATSPAPTGGSLRSSLQYDLLGRLSLQQDYGGIASLSSGTVTYSRTLSYNAKNQILVDDSTTMRLRAGSSSLYDTWRTITRNDYDADGNLNTHSGINYALGSIIWQHGQTYKNGDTNAIDDTMTRFDYVWWDSAVQSGIVYDKHYGWSNNNGPTFNLNNFNNNFITSYTLNGFGQTSAAFVNDGVAKSVAYTLDAAGQIVRRKETRTSNTAQAAPVEVFYRFAGKTMGMVGNNGTGDVSYDASITARSAASPAITSTNAGLFRNGTNTGSSFYADFSQSIDPYNSGQQGSAGGGTYSVRSGDTLQGIAAALYGDGNLWYRIAEANGLSAGAALSEGQSLILPAGVTKNTHNASTFQPYDAAEAMGDTLPTTPKPPKTPKCGAFGAIIMVAIAVAVTALTAGAALSAVGAVKGGILSGAGAFLGIGSATIGTVGGISATALAVGAGVVGGAVGSIASQGFGVAAGLQDKFSWKGVGMAAIAGGIGGGLRGLSVAAGKAGEGGLKGIAGLLTRDGLANTVARAAIANAATQGISVATRLQKSFSWTGLAASAAGAAVGYGAGSAFEATSLAAEGGNTLGNHAANFGASAVSLLANAGARSLLSGTDFGDNIIASLPDAIVDTIGNVIKFGVAGDAAGKGAVIEVFAAENIGPKGPDGEKLVWTKIPRPGRGATKAEWAEYDRVDLLQRWWAQDSDYKPVSDKLMADRFKHRAKLIEEGNRYAEHLDPDLVTKVPYFKPKVTIGGRRPTARVAERRVITEEVVDHTPIEVTGMRVIKSEDPPISVANVDYDLLIGPGLLADLERPSDSPLRISNYSDGVQNFTSEAAMMAAGRVSVARSTSAYEIRQGFENNARRQYTTDFINSRSPLGLTPFDSLALYELNNGAPLQRVQAIDNIGTMFGGVVLASQLGPRRMQPSPFPQNAYSISGPAVPGRYSLTGLYDAPYNISTVGKTPAERQSIFEYARRSNSWLLDNGGTTVQSTAGSLRSQSNSTARRERLNAARLGTPYQGQVGHVPDTALTGQAHPPAGWLDMLGISNNAAGGGLSSRIGQRVDIITVDGKIP